MPMKVVYTVMNGEVVAERRNGVRSLHLPDTLGSTVALMSSSQTITDTFQYWPYGEVAARTGTTVTPFQFVGGQGYSRDSASRDYVRARTLRTDLGRWLTADPIGIDAGDFNLYRYGRGTVPAATDPSGLWCWHLWDGGCVGTTCHGDPACPATNGGSKRHHINKNVQKCVTAGIQHICEQHGLDKEFKWCNNIVGNVGKVTAPIDCSQCGGNLMDAAAKCRDQDGDDIDLGPPCLGNGDCLRLHCVDNLLRKYGHNSYVKYCLTTCAGIPWGMLPP